MCGAVVEKITSEREVVGSNSVGCVVREKCRNLQLWRSGCVAGQWGPPPIKSFLFPIFKISFLKNSLPLPCAQQRNSLPMPVCRVSFAVCNTRQTLLHKRFIGVGEMAFLGVDVAPVPAFRC